MSNMNEIKQQIKDFKKTMNSFDDKLDSIKALAVIVEGLISARADTIDDVKIEFDNRIKLIEKDIKQNKTKLFELENKFEKAHKDLSEKIENNKKELIDRIEQINIDINERVADITYDRLEIYTDIMFPRDINEKVKSIVKQDISNKENEIQNEIIFNNNQSEQVTEPNNENFNLTQYPTQPIDEKEIWNLID